MRKCRRTHRFKPVLFASLSVYSLLFFPSGVAHAATLTLKNGDKITGKVIQLTDDQIEFKSAVFGKVQVPFKKVVQLISDDNTRIELKDGRTVTGKVTLDDQGHLLVDQGSLGQSTLLTRNDLEALNPPVVDNRVKYTGHFNVGGSYNRGNSRDDLLNINGEFVARTPQNRYTVGLELNEAKSDGVKTTSNSRLITQYDAFLTKQDYLFVNFQAEKDSIADLNLRTSLGGGYGRQFIDNDLTQFSGQAGLGYVNEDNIVAADRSFPTLTIGLKYDHKFFNKKVVFFNHSTLDTNLQDTKDMLFRNRLGLRVPVADHVNVSTQLNVDYDNEPVPGNKKTDSALIFSVGYGF
ncbi:MAG TPA: DUF481 domain-containing protein [Limnobacter sp.]|uniref:DUF481 domain-containing protein n=1 Tax=Limnobacter sp. TaxID=2003368 RepID=UPI002E36696D|nr:DUF481 domain-containing protein [Limnobacter sp.]HEX5486989.1 DUF481 domain-containing protein [Limnobacter sp.]